MQTNRKPRTSVIETAIIVGIVVFANILGYMYFWRLDLTENKQYTISPATRSILRELKDPVSVEFFMSQDMPSQMIRLREDVRNRLQELDIYGGANFRVRYTDPGDDTEAQTRAESLGVPKFQLQVIKQEAASVQDVFFGMVLNYQDQSEAIPQVLDPASLEYEIASRLKRMTMDEKPKIAYFAGTMNINEQQGSTYEGVKQLLGGAQGFYEVVELDPATDKTLPEGVAGVVVLGAFGLSDDLKYAIDQFMMNGGTVFMAFDAMMQAGQQMGGMGDAFPSLPTIEDQLKAYGLNVNKKLVVDEQCAQVQMRMSIFQVLQPYPLFPDIGPENITDEVPALARLERVVLPYVAPLSDEAREGVTFTPLFFSTENSFLMNSPFKLDPQQNWEFLASTSEERGPFKLGYLVSGAIPSAFPDGPPPPVGSAEGGAAPMSPFDESKHVAKAREGGRLLVIPTANAFSDNMMGQFQENALLLANIADMLALGDELSAIRSAPVTARPLKTLTDQQKSFIRWSGIVVLPLLVVVLGVIVWAWRARRRRAIQHRYAG